MKIRKWEASYEKDGMVFSALQRREIIELDTETNCVQVVGKFTDYSVASKACGIFNELELKKLELQAKQQDEMRNFIVRQREAFKEALEQEKNCKCRNCIQ